MLLVQGQILQKYGFPRFLPLGSEGIVVKHFRVVDWSTIQWLFHSMRINSKYSLYHHGLLDLKMPILPAHAEISFFRAWSVRSYNLDVNIILSGST